MQNQQIQVFGRYLIHNAMSIWDACLVWNDAASNDETPENMCHLMTLVIELNRR